MKTLLKTLALSALLVLPASTASAQVSFDLHLGAPPAPRAYRVPARPGPDYVWVEGYWFPQGKRYEWHNGYWTRPPYAGAYWVAPYYSGNQYFAGRWEGDHGVVDHNHTWDKSRQRDEGRPAHDDHDRR